MVNTITPPNKHIADIAGSGSDEAHFRERLQSLVDRISGGNVAAFARLSRVPHTTLRKHLSGETEASRVNLLRYAAAALVNVGWLVSGDAEAASEAEPSPQASPLSGRHVEIPLFAVELSAGPGRMPWSAAAEETLRLPHALVRDIFRAQGELLAVRVSGDSMEPTIRDGSVVVIERATHRIDRDGQVYALRQDDALLIKRAHMLPGIGLRLRGDNPASPEVTLAPADAERLQVLGRVVGVLNRP
jgi:phage repressor protein C with HTH and peptisase S24 domain